jgi:hypothetical protein
MAAACHSAASNAAFIFFILYIYLADFIRDMLRVECPFKSITWHNNQSRPPLNQQSANSVMEPAVWSSKLSG